MWPAVALDDAVADEEAEARAVHALRREEGLEDARAHLLGHPRAGVREEQRAGARRRRRQLIDEPAARGHRVDGVDDEVDEDLAQLRGVAARVQSRASHLDRHVVAQAARARVVLPARARDLDGVAQKLAHVRPPRAPRPGVWRAKERMRRTVAAASSAAVRMMSSPRATSSSRGRAAQELRAAEDGGERVVEVVRDARGELAERAQLVGLRGALALLPLLGHVARDGEHARRAAVDDERRRSPMTT